MTDPESTEFSNALAELHVCATVLEPYSEGMVEAIDRYTEDLPEDEQINLSNNSDTVTN
jgi:hypothetical protein